MLNKFLDYFKNRKNSKLNFVAVGSDKIKLDCADSDELFCNYMFFKLTRGEEPKYYKIESEKLEKQTYSEITVEEARYIINKNSIFENQEEIKVEEQKNTKDEFSEEEMQARMDEVINKYKNKKE